MIKNLTFTAIILLITTVTIFGQTREDNINGPKTEYYPDGTRMKEYTLVNGVMEGVYKMYSEDGALQIEQYMVNGLGHGYYRTYFKNGVMRSEDHMKNGLFEGPSKEYYENGQLKRDSYCQGDGFHLTGLVTLYREDGSLISVTELADGQLIHSMSYFPDGRLKGEEMPGQNITYTYQSDGKVVKLVNGKEE